MGVTNKSATNPQGTNPQGVFGFSDSLPHTPPCDYYCYRQRVIPVSALHSGDVPLDTGEGVGGWGGSVGQPGRKKRDPRT
jgi:hypothetical protein